MSSIEKDILTCDYCCKMGFKSEKGWSVSDTGVTICPACMSSLYEASFKHSNTTDNITMRICIPLEDGYTIEGDSIVCPTGEAYPARLYGDGTAELDIVDGDIHGVIVGRADKKTGNVMGIRSQHILWTMENR